MSINSFVELEDRRKSAIQSGQQITRRVIVCGGTGCLANGAREVFSELVLLGKEHHLPVTFSLDHDEFNNKPKNYLTLSGCQGFCQQGPLVHILQEDILYTKVKPPDVKRIVQSTLIESKILEDLLYKDSSSGCSCQKRSSVPFYAGQTQFILRRVGKIDPTSLSAYLEEGGFSALQKVLAGMTPSQVVGEVLESQLRGRGGAGFLTGKKWQVCSSMTGDEKYIICNGDEGDPGAFMDCAVMEGDPFSILEGMIIAGYAIGANQGIIYVRQEYPLAVQRLTHAVEILGQENLLGQDILSSKFSFDVKIKMGAGAFVCGEETALMQSVEGQRGTPRPRPPYPAQSGLFRKPTVINNVETLANIEGIINQGSDWYNALGTTTSKGTKVFSLTGKINNTGLVEVVMGTTLRRLIFDIGGGIPDGKQFKAVQIGGPSGGCLPAAHLDSKIDYESLKNAGAMMGSGGMVVMDEDTCMVDVARYFVNFCSDESCGKCVPCREGLNQLGIILEKIATGCGEINDLLLIENLCKVMQSSSLCALGQTAANPVITSLNSFRQEYLAHIDQKQCPAGVCKALITYSITDACTGCGLCLKNCPVNAITGKRKQMHTINSLHCTRCGNCREVCAYHAVLVK
jgi:NADH:ubiquinone oxidoreductase subunit F (NADH-binding)/(2Fe-2S) ferredoxin